MTTIGTTTIKTASSSSNRGKCMNCVTDDVTRDTYCGRSCFQKMKLGAQLGGSVGAVLGMLFGGYTLVR